MWVHINAWDRTYLVLLLKHQVLADIYIDELFVIYSVVLQVMTESPRTPNTLAFFVFHHVLLLLLPLLVVSVFD